MTLFCVMNADNFALNASCSSAIITSLKEARFQATSVLVGGEDQNCHYIRQGTYFFPSDMNKQSPKSNIV